MAEKTRQELRDERVERLHDDLVIALACYRGCEAVTVKRSLAVDVAKALDAYDAETGVASYQVPHDRRSQ